MSDVKIKGQAPAQVTDAEYREVKVSPTGGLETYGAAAPFALILDDTTTANVTYVCKAKIGAAAASAVWQIMKIDETSGMIITWADGDSLFNNIAANRAVLSYS